MDTTTTSTEATHLADVIRSSAAWWRRAADQLEACDLEGAIGSAKLATFGTEGMVERIASTVTSVEEGTP